jgi:hypothetical protein
VTGTSERSGSRRRIGRRRGTGIQLTGIDSGGDEGDEEDSIQGRSSSSAAKKGKSLLEAVDEAGLSLKPRAERAAARLALAGGGSSSSRGRKFRYLVQACVLYAGFIVYRAYRGLFVILPAVFRRVYERLERAVDSAPFDGDGSDDGEPEEDDAGGDVDPATGRVRWRTRATISVLASIVTASYVVGGAARVAARFASSLLRTSGDVSESLRAAADEQEENEGKILRRLAIEATVGEGGGRGRAGAPGGERVNGTASRDGDDDSGAGDERPDGTGRLSDLAP